MNSRQKCHQTLNVTDAFYLLFVSIPLFANILQYFLFGRATHCAWKWKKKKNFQLGIISVLFNILWCGPHLHPFTAVLEYNLMIVFVMLPFSEQFKYKSFMLMVITFYSRIYNRKSKHIAVYTIALKALAESFWVL